MSVGLSPLEGMDCIWTPGNLQAPTTRVQEGHYCIDTEEDVVLSRVRSQCFWAKEKKTFDVCTSCRYSVGMWNVVSMVFKYLPLR